MKGESSVNALERSSVMADKVADGSPTYDERLAMQSELSVVYFCEPVEIE